ncbi:hypothetical protein BRC86_02825 [Halobacteriales archaeon QS_3_64_16]|nr:MAG: hypothetical protein BRC86_02825 [Halobacteriales archaeon QS_3_64_16]
MDTTKQLYETEASGWQRGLYDDIQHTFRAPTVNWIFRTTMANYPDFLRYAWGQLKPLYTTRAFARFSTAYRDAVLSTIEDATPLPTYRRAALGIAPAEYRELRGQVGTFDVVAPRLALLFEVCDRALRGEPIGTEPEEDYAATAPFPAGLDRDRGRLPTMIDADSVPDGLVGTVDSIQDFHGLDDGLPSIYRCLCQWPAYLDRAWADLEPVVRGEGFEQACAEASDRTDAFVDATPYQPRLDPDSLRAAGFDDDVISDLQGLFEEFNGGAIETVIPALPVYAATLDASGRRAFR